MEFALFAEEEFDLGGEISLVGGGAGVEQEKFIERVGVAISHDDTRFGLELPFHPVVDAAPVLAALQHDPFDPGSGVELAVAFFLKDIVSVFGVCHVFGCLLF
jgi:hypothetical protein